MQSTSKGINKSFPISTQKEKHKTHWKNSFDRNQNKISRAFATPSRLSLGTMSWFFSSGWPPASILSLSNQWAMCFFPINGSPIFWLLSRYTSHASDPSPLSDKIKKPRGVTLVNVHALWPPILFSPKKLTGGKIKRLVKYFFPSWKIGIRTGRPLNSEEKKRRHLWTWVEHKKNKRTTGSRHEKYLKKSLTVNVRVK